mgnify:CR=1 FL=1
MSEGLSSKHYLKVVVLGESGYVCIFEMWSIFIPTLDTHSTVALEFFSLFLSLTGYYVYYRVGKTCLMTRFIKKTYQNIYRATIGADFVSKVIEVDGNVVSLQVAILYLSSSLFSRIMIPVIL